MQTIHTIKKIIRETPKAVSVILDGKIKYQPGQFIMLWLPGVDEKPFAVSYLEHNEFGITIEEKGRFTQTISKIKVGTKVGIRGPYGNGFKIKNNSIIIAGGLGMAPALSLIKKIKNSWNVFINSGRTDTGIDAISWAKKAVRLGAGEILLTSIDRDGTKKGFDTSLTRLISANVTVPVIASGGAGRLEDFLNVLTEGQADAALAASLFHFKELTIKDVKDFLFKKKIPIRLV